MIEILLVLAGSFLLIVSGSMGGWRSAGGSVMAAIGFIVNLTAVGVPVIEHLAPFFALVGRLLQGGVRG